MGCFIVPVTEAVVTTAATKILQRRENQAEKNPAERTELFAENKIQFSEKLKWLNNMLWGGSALLCFEHIWHGEVVPYFPFLTAMSDPADAMELFHEMGTVGVSMSILVTAVWAGMVAVSNMLEKKPLAPQPVRGRREP